MAAVTTAIALGVGAVATTAGYFEQKKAAREAERKQESANNVAQASSQVKQARARRRSIAQARMAQARNQANQGASVGSSSALQGVQSGLSAQLGSNIGFQGSQVRSQQQVFDHRQGAQNAMQKGAQRAGAWNSLAGMAQFGAQNFSMPSGGGGNGINSQGQAAPLYDNPAFVKNM